MAYTLSFDIALGAGRTGLTLEAQLVNTSGANVGSASATGFVEIGAGNYLWTGSVPDGHRGGVRFQQSGGGTLLGFAAINPEEAENLDAKVSSRTARSAVLTELSAGTPPATPTLEQAVMLLYMALRNKMNTTATLLTFHNDNGDVIAKAGLSDNGVTFVRDELQAP